MVSPHPQLKKVTDRVIERSKPTRAAYLARIDDAPHGQFPARARCRAPTWRTASPASTANDKFAASRQCASRTSPSSPSYNDMLSAHQPFERFPRHHQAGRARGRRRRAVRRRRAGDVRRRHAGPAGHGAVAVHARRHRDGTAVALSHNMFDAALCLGVCDKIVPGLLIGALHVRPPAGDLRAGRADADRPVQQGEGRSPPAVRRRQGRPRRAARGGSRRRTTRPAPARSTAPPTATRC